MITSDLEQDILSLINSVQMPRKKNDVSDFLILMDRFRNPHLNLPKTVHVAGTNGKGSTLAFLKSILEASGHCIHRYTSPHLVSICERIEINGAPIKPHIFLESLKKVVEKSHGLALSFFDYITAVAFIEFSKAPADFLLLETGLGGSHDNTNIIPNPVVTILTQIGMDHMDVLGDTLPQIAMQKAGIIKHDCPVVTGLCEKDVLDVITKQAHQRQAKLFVEGPIEESPGLIGQHQKQNAALAVKAAQLISNPSHAAIQQGLKNAVWHGRMQTISIGSRLVWLDIAHNPSGAKSAVETMNQMGQPLHILFSLRKTKEMPPFIVELARFAKTLTYIGVDGALECHQEQDVINACELMGISCGFNENILHALESTPEGNILITGSVFLVGQALKMTGSKNV